MARSLLTMADSIVLLRFAVMSEKRSGHPDTTLPLVSEELEVSKRIHESSHVHVRTGAREREVLVEEPLVREEAEVQRIPINRAIEEPLDVRYEGDVLVIPVVEEVLVVRKQLMLMEEIRIRRRAVEHRHSERVKLRREEVAIERLPSDGAHKPK